MGYTDAYGNTIDDIPPQAKKIRKSSHPGAYGYRKPDNVSRPLPDPDLSSTSPAWTFK